MTSRSSGLRASGNQSSLCLTHIPGQHTRRSKKRTGLGAHPSSVSKRRKPLNYRGKINSFLLTLCQEFWTQADQLIKKMEGQIKLAQDRAGDPNILPPVQQQYSETAKRIRESLTQLRSAR